MADPFNPEDVEKYKALFKREQSPRVFGTPEGLASLEAERSGLASFLGVPDYDAQLEKSREDAKLQFYLQMAQRGFAAAGAAPRRGESTVSTLSRELFSPLAGDASKLAGQFTKEKRAIDTAKKAGDRQIRLAALQNVQRRQDQAYTDEAAATDKARQFLIKAATKGAKVSTAFTVKQKDGSFVRKPVIVKTDWKGNVTHTDAEGKVIPANSIGVYAKPTAGIKPSIQKATDIEIMVQGPVNPDGSPGKVTYQPVNAQIITTFKTDGSVGSTRMTEPTTGKVLVTSGPSANARMAPKAGSKTSLYYPPGKGTSIYPTDKFAEAFGLPKKLVGAKAVLQTFTPKPDLGKGLPEIQQIRVAGKTYSLRDHKNYNEETGNIDLDTKEGKVTIDASSLWRLEDPKAFTSAGEMMVPSDQVKLKAIRDIPGLTGVGAGDALKVERNNQGLMQVRRGNVVVTLTPRQANLFQTRALDTSQQLQAGQTVEKFTSTGNELTVGVTNLDKLKLVPGLENVSPGEKIELLSIEGVPALGIPTQFQYRYAGTIVNIPSSVLQSGVLLRRPLSNVEEVAAGQVTEARNSYVNTGVKTLIVGNQSIGPGQTGHFSKTDLSTNEFLNAAGDFQNAGPVSIDSKAYMFIGFDPQKIGEVEYAPGDEIRLTRQQLENLKPELQKALSADTQLRSNTIKSNFLRSLWGNVVTNNAASLKQGGIDTKKLLPSEKQLQSLLAMFPAGMRSGGDKLQNKIFEMIKLDATANQDGQPTGQSATALKNSQNYAVSVAKRLDSAKTRYDSYKKTGFLPSEQPWESLGYEDKVAFANLQDVLQPKNVQGLWDNAKDRLAKAKKDYAPVSTDDIASFSAATELLILAKYLKQSQDVSKSGVFTGSLRKFGVDKFADVGPLTSGASKRLLTIINRMRASYGTLTEKGGRDSVFKQQLQAGLIPAFDTSESMNLSNLSSIINRLETNIRSSLTNETLATNVVPKSFEIMAKEAGITGVNVDQRRYPWIDPNKPDIVPVTRQKTMDAINLEPFSIEDARDLTVGRLLPPDSETPNVRYIKIRNLDEEVLIQQADRTGKPLSGAPKWILQMDLGTRLQRSKVQ